MQYHTASVNLVRGGFSLCLLVGATGAFLIYPLGSGWLLALAAYAAALWRYPGIALPAVLAALPVLDFGQWSGWVLINELDLVIAVTVGVRLLRPTEPAAPALSPAVKWTIGAVGASFLASAMIGFLPVAAFDANALFGPYGGWSALRQLKGFAWSLALLPILIEQGRQPGSLEDRCAFGMVLGLAATLAVILWQRVTFAGLLDFAEVYRVEGLFPELHTGGGDVHAYLVSALPFVLAWSAVRPTSRRVAPGAALFVLATYAVGVTFTRGAYVGYAAAFVVLCIALARHRSPPRDGRWARIATVAVLAGIGIAVLLPIVSGSFMEARLAGTQSEAATRVRHWTRTLDMMDKDWRTTLFGMGLGSFPRTFLFRHADAASGTFRYERENDNQFLRLGSGRPLYLDQRVDVSPSATYTLSLDMRSSDASARLDALLCEKSIQYSFRCQVATFQDRAGTGSWAHRESALESGDVGSGPWPLRRPTALSLTNPRIGSIVDVDNVRLREESGRDLIVNGDFSEGGARWLFGADDHLPWHIFNLGVEILFEQGWLGILAVGGLLVLALHRNALALWRGDLYAGVLVASLVGFLAIGLTESLFDGPRLTTLFFVLILISLVRRPGPSGRDAAPGPGRE